MDLFDFLLMSMIKSRVSRIELIVDFLIMIELILKSIDYLSLISLYLDNVIFESLYLSLFGLKYLIELIALLSFRLKLLIIFICECL